MDPDEKKARGRHKKKFDLLNNSRWLPTCGCCGIGCIGPCAFSQEHTSKIGNVRCEEVGGEHCCGELGCINGSVKCLCCFSKCQFPGGGCRVAMANKFCVGDRPGGLSSSNMTAEETEQLVFAEEAMWCLYCCCAGWSLGRIADPCCKAQYKWCCQRDTCESADCCGSTTYSGTTAADGCCYSYGRECCLTWYVQCPPAMSMTPGFGIWCFASGKKLDEPEARDLEMRQAYPSDV